MEWSMEWNTNGISPCMDPERRGGEEGEMRLRVRVRMGNGMGNEWSNGMLPGFSCSGVRNGSPGMGIH